MFRFLWDRLGESSDTRLLRIRRLGFLRFCAIYVLVFPLGHAVMAAVRAALVGSTEGLAHLPVEMAGWAAAGMAVAAFFWLLGLPRKDLRAARSAVRCEPTATPGS
jgi:hypothetical protein